MNDGNIGGYSPAVFSDPDFAESLTKLHSILSNGSALQGDLNTHIANLCTEAATSRSSFDVNPNADWGRLAPSSSMFQKSRAIGGLFHGQTYDAATHSIRNHIQSISTPNVQDAPAVEPFPTDAHFLQATGELKPLSSQAIHDAIVACMEAHSQRLITLKYRLMQRWRRCLRLDPLAASAPIRRRLMLSMRILDTEYARARLRVQAHVEAHAKTTSKSSPTSTTATTTAEGCLASPPSDFSAPCPCLTIGDVRTYLSYTLPSQNESLRLQMLSQRLALTPYINKKPIIATAYTYASTYTHTPSIFPSLADIPASAANSTGTSASTAGGTRQETVTSAVTPSMHGAHVDVQGILTSRAVPESAEGTVTLLPYTHTPVSPSTSTSSCSLPLPTSTSTSASTSPSFPSTFVASSCPPVIAHDLCSLSLNGTPCHGDTIQCIPGASAASQPRGHRIRPSRPPSFGTLPSFSLAESDTASCLPPPPPPMLPLCTHAVAEAIAQMDIIRSPGVPLSFERGHVLHDHVLAAFPRRFAQQQPLLSRLTHLPLSLASSPLAPGIGPLAALLGKAGMRAGTAGDATTAADTDINETVLEPALWLSHSRLGPCNTAAETIYAEGTRTCQETVPTVGTGVCSDTAPNSTASPPRATHTHAQMHCEMGNPNQSSYASASPLSSSASSSSFDSFDASALPTSTTASSFARSVLSAGLSGPEWVPGAGQPPDASVDSLLWQYYVVCSNNDLAAAQEAVQMLADKHVEHAIVQIISSIVDKESLSACLTTGFTHTDVDNLSSCVDNVPGQLVSESTSLSWLSIPMLSTPTSATASASMSTTTPASTLTFTPISSSTSTTAAHTLPSSLNSPMLTLFTHLRHSLARVAPHTHQLHILYSLLLLQARSLRLRLLSLLNHLRATERKLVIDDLGYVPSDATVLTASDAAPTRAAMPAGPRLSHRIERLNTRGVLASGASVLLGLAGGATEEGDGGEGEVGIWTERAIQHLERDGDAVMSLRRTGIVAYETVSEPVTSLAAWERDEDVTVTLQGRPVCFDVAVHDLLAREADMMRVASAFLRDQGRRARRERRVRSQRERVHARMTASGTAGAGSSVRVSASAGSTRPSTATTPGYMAATAASGGAPLSTTPTNTPTVDPRLSSLLPSAANPLDLHGDCVDRFRLLVQLYQHEHAFASAKVALVDAMMASYEHCEDAGAQRELAKAVVEVIHRAPSIDVPVPVREAEAEGGEGAELFCHRGGGNGGDPGIGLNSHGVVGDGFDEYGYGCGYDDEDIDADDNTTAIASVSDLSSQRRPRTDTPTTNAEAISRGRGVSASGKRTSTSQGTLGANGGSNAATGSDLFAGAAMDVNMTKGDMMGTCGFDAACEEAPLVWLTHYYSAASEEMQLHALLLTRLCSSLIATARATRPNTAPGLAASGDWRLHQQRVPVEDMDGLIKRLFDMGEFGNSQGHTHTGNFSGKESPGKHFSQFIPWESQDSEEFPLPETADESLLALSSLTLPYFGLSRHTLRHAPSNTHTDSDTDSDTNLHGNANTNISTVAGIITDPVCSGAATTGADSSAPAADAASSTSPPSASTSPPMPSPTSTSTPTPSPTPTPASSSSSLSSSLQHKHTPTHGRSHVPLFLDLFPSVAALPCLLTSAIAHTATHLYPHLLQHMATGAKPHTYNTVTGAVLSPPRVFGPVWLRVALKRAVLLHFLIISASFASFDPVADIVRHDPLPLLAHTAPPSNTTSSPDSSSSCSSAPLTPLPSTLTASLPLARAQVLALAVSLDADLTRNDSTNGTCSDGRSTGTSVSTGRSGIRNNTAALTTADTKSPTLFSPTALRPNPSSLPPPSSVANSTSSPSSSPIASMATAHALASVYLFSTHQRFLLALAAAPTLTDPVHAVDALMRVWLAHSHNIDAAHTHAHAHASLHTHTPIPTPVPSPAPSFPFSTFTPASTFTSTPTPPPPRSRYKFTPQEYLSTCVALTPSHRYVYLSPYVSTNSMTFSSPLALYVPCHISALLALPQHPMLQVVQDKLLTDASISAPTFTLASRIIEASSLRYRLLLALYHSAALEDTYRMQALSVGLPAAPTLVPSWLLAPLTSLKAALEGVNSGADALSMPSAYMWGDLASAGMRDLPHMQLTHPTRHAHETQQRQSTHITLATGKSSPSMPSTTRDTLTTQNASVLTNNSINTSTGTSTNTTGPRASPVPALYALASAASSSSLSASHTPASPRARAVTAAATAYVLRMHTALIPRLPALPLTCAVYRSCCDVGVEALNITASNNATASSAATAAVDTSSIHSDHTNASQGSSVFCTSPTTRTAHTAFLSPGLSSLAATSAPRHDPLLPHCAPAAPVLLAAVEVAEHLPLSFEAMVGLEEVLLGTRVFRPHAYRERMSLAATRAHAEMLTTTSMHGHARAQTHADERASTTPEALTTTLSTHTLPTTLSHSPPPASSLLDSLRMCLSVQTTHTRALATAVELHHVLAATHAIEADTAPPSISSASSSSSSSMASSSPDLSSSSAAASSVMSSLSSPASPSPFSVPSSSTRAPSIHSPRDALTTQDLSSPDIASLLPTPPSRGYLSAHTHLSSSLPSFLSLPSPLYPQSNFPSLGLALPSSLPHPFALLPPPARPVLLRPHPSDMNTHAHAPAAGQLPLTVLCTSPYASSTSTSTAPSTSSSSSLYSRQRAQSVGTRVRRVVYRPGLLLQLALPTNTPLAALCALYHHSSPLMHAPAPSHTHLLAHTQLHTAAATHTHLPRLNLRLSELSAMLAAAEQRILDSASANALPALDLSPAFHTTYVPKPASSPSLAVSALPQTHLAVPYAYAEGALTLSCFTPLWLHKLEPLAQARAAFVANLAAKAGEDGGARVAVSSESMDLDVGGVSRTVPWLLQLLSCYDMRATHAGTSSHTSSSSSSSPLSSNPLLPTASLGPSLAPLLLFSASLMSSLDIPAYVSRVLPLSRHLRYIHHHILKEASPFLDGLDLTTTITNTASNTNTGTNPRSITSSLASLTGSPHAYQPSSSNPAGAHTSTTNATPTHTRAHANAHARNHAQADHHSPPGPSLHAAALAYAHKLLHLFPPASHAAHNNTHTSMHGSAAMSGSSSSSSLLSTAPAAVSDVDDINMHTHSHTHSRTQAHTRSLNETTTTTTRSAHTALMPHSWLWHLPPASAFLSLLLPPRTITHTPGLAPTPSPARLRLDLCLRSQLLDIAHNALFLTVLSEPAPPLQRRWVGVDAFPSHTDALATPLPRAMLRDARHASYSTPSSVFASTSPSTEPRFPTFTPRANAVSQQLQRLTQLDSLCTLSRPAFLISLLTPPLRLPHTPALLPAARLVFAHHIMVSMPMPPPPSPLHLLTRLLHFREPPVDDMSMCDAPEDALMSHPSSSSSSSSLSYCHASSPSSSSCILALAATVIRRAQTLHALSSLILHVIARNASSAFPSMPRTLPPPSAVAPLFAATPAQALAAAPHMALAPDTGLPAIAALSAHTDAYTTSSSVTAAECSPFTEDAVAKAVDTPFLRTPLAPVVTNAPHWPQLAFLFAAEETARSKAVEEAQMLQRWLRAASCSENGTRGGRNSRASESAKIRSGNTGASAAVRGGFALWEDYGSGNGGVDGANAMAAVAATEHTVVTGAGVLSSALLQGGPLYWLESVPAVPLMRVSSPLFSPATTLSTSSPCCISASQACSALHSLASNPSNASTARMWSSLTHPSHSTAHPHTPAVLAATRVFTSFPLGALARARMTALHTLSHLSLEAHTARIVVMATLAHDSSFRLFYTPDKHAETDSAASARGSARESGRRSQPHQQHGQAHQQQQTTTATASGEDANATSPTDATTLRSLTRILQVHHDTLHSLGRLTVSAADIASSASTSKSISSSATASTSVVAPMRWWSAGVAGYYLRETQLPTHMCASPHNSQTTPTSRAGTVASSMSTHAFPSTSLAYPCVLADTCLLTAVMDMRSSLRLFDAHMLLRVLGDADHPLYSILHTSLRTSTVHTPSIVAMVEAAKRPLAQGIAYASAYATSSPMLPSLTSCLSIPAHTDLFLTFALACPVPQPAPTPLNVHIPALPHGIALGDGQGLPFAPSLADEAGFRGYTRTSDDIARQFSVSMPLLTEHPAADMHRPLQCLLMTWHDAVADLLHPAQHELATMHSSLADSIAVAYDASTTEISAYSRGILPDNAMVLVNTKDVLVGVCVPKHARDVPPSNSAALPVHDVAHLAHATVIHTLFTERDYADTHVEMEVGPDDEEQSIVWGTAWTGDGGASSAGAGADTGNGGGVVASSVSLCGASPASLNLRLLATQRHVAQYTQTLLALYHHDISILAHVFQTTRHAHIPNSRAYAPTLTHDTPAALHLLRTHLTHGTTLSTLETASALTIPTFLRSAGPLVGLSISSHARELGPVDHPVLLSSVMAGVGACMLALEEFRTDAAVVSHLQARKAWLSQQQARINEATYQRTHARSSQALRAAESTRLALQEQMRGVANLRDDLVVVNQDDLLRFLLSATGLAYEATKCHNAQLSPAIAAAATLTTVHAQRVYRHMVTQALGLVRAYTCMSMFSCSRTRTHAQMQTQTQRHPHMVMHASGYADRCLCPDCGRASSIGGVSRALVRETEERMLSALTTVSQHCSLGSSAGSLALGPADAEIGSGSMMWHMLVHLRDRVSSQSHGAAMREFERVSAYGYYLYMRTQTLVHRVMCVMRAVEEHQRRLLIDDTALTPADMQAIVRSVYGSGMDMYKDLPALSPTEVKNAVLFLSTKAQRPSAAREASTLADTAATQTPMSYSRAQHEQRERTLLATLEAQLGAHQQQLRHVDAWAAALAKGDAVLSATEGALSQAFTSADPQQMVRQVHANLSTVAIQVARAIRDRDMPSISRFLSLIPPAPVLPLSSALARWGQGWIHAHHHLGRAQEDLRGIETGVGLVQNSVNELRQWLLECRKAVPELQKEKTMWKLVTAQLKYPEIVRQVIAEMEKDESGRLT